MPRRKGGGISDDLYSGAASYGRFTSLLGLIFLSLFGIGFLCAAIYFWTTPPTHSEEVEGTITKSTCQSSLRSTQSGGSSSKTSCSTTVQYQVDETLYTTSLYIEKAVSEGDTITLVYNPNKPQDVQLKGMSQVLIGFILFGVAFILIGIGVLNYYMARRYKFAAAATGVSSGVSMLQSAWK